MIQIQDLIKYTDCNDVNLNFRKRNTDLLPFEPDLSISDKPESKRARIDGYQLREKCKPSELNRIDCWVHNFLWPKEDFEASETMDNPRQKRSRSSSSSRSLPSSRYFDENATMSDQRSREFKSSPYRSPNYIVLLEMKNTFFKDSDAGMLSTDEEICVSLLDKPQPIPQESLFDESCFAETCANLQDENESRVVIDLLRLIAPSAENLAARGLKELKCLKELTNAGWNDSIPVEGPRPQPDYSVGYRYSTFSKDQLNKLHSNLRLGTKTYYSGTMKMYFPFFTTEVKCGQQGLDIADRQNAHSMTVAMRGVIELFRRVGRENDLHRKVLGFSISFNDKWVMIYAHYPEVHLDGISTSCYRRQIKSYSISNNEGAERWAANRFVRNVYESFAPKHLLRITQAIDLLPKTKVGSSMVERRGGDDAERGRSGEDNSAAVSSSTPLEKSGENVVGVAARAKSDETAFKKPEVPTRRGTGTVAELRFQLETLLEERIKERDETKREKEQLMTILQNLTSQSTSQSPFS